MVTEEVIVEKVPICKDQNGVFRILGTRVQLEMIILDFQGGATPEQLAQDYSSVPLADVYQVIAYYLRHKEDVDAYVKRREQETDELRTKIQAEFPQGAMREQLLKRRQSS